MIWLLLSILLTGCTNVIDMPKTFEINESPFGLCADPNALKAPKGALKVVDNCIINRDGIIEARNGAEEVSLDASNLAYIYRMYNFDNDLLLYDGSAPYWEFLGNLGTLIQDEDGNDPWMFPYYQRTEETRGNIYIPCQDGVRKITGADSSEMFLAGILNDLMIYNYSTYNITEYNWWTAATYIKYTATIQRKDANDVIIESARIFPIVLGQAIGTLVPVLTLAIGPSLREGDVIRFFRTPMSDSYLTLGDTFYLSGEHIITSAEIGVGYAVWYDKTPDDELSEYLYTNSEQEGIDRSNYMPPVAKCLSMYQGSMFYSNVIEPPRLVLTVKCRYNEIGGVANGAGVRLVTGTTTASSNRITAVSDYTGITVGQLVYSAAGIPANSYVIAVSAGNYVDISNNATASGARDLSIQDTITFGFGSTYETYSLGITSVTGEHWKTHYLEYNVIPNSSLFRVERLSDLYKDDFALSSIAITRRDLNSSTFYVWGTHGAITDDAYDKPLSPPTWNGSAFVFATEDGVESDMLVKPNRQYWSKNGKPESIPMAGAYHDVGNGTAIIQTEPIKDGLLVFKDDGIYSVTGSGERSGWTVRLVDKDNVLANPMAVVHVDGYAYAVTNRGFVRANLYGVEKISTPYIDYGYPSSTTSFLNRILYFINRRRAGNTLAVPFVEYDRRGNNILIGFDEAYNTYTTRALVYNLKTNAFSTWSTSAYFRHFISVDSDSQHLYYGGRYCSSNPDFTIQLWKSFDLRGRDHERNVTVSSKPDSTTINFTTDHFAIVGDYVVNNSSTEQQKILTVVDSDTVTVADNSNISGACKIYTPITSTITWLPKFGATRAFKKHFYAYGLVFMENPYQYSIEFFEGGSTYGPFDLAKTTERRLVPIAAARRFFIEPTITIEDLINEWQLVGLSLEYSMQAPRGAK
jgi:hypothetical protein